MFCFFYIPTASRTLAPQGNAADTRLNLQAQLTNANKPRVYFEFVKG